MSEPASPYKGKTGLRRVLNAAIYSWAGLGAALKHEDAFRQEAFLALLLIPLALYLGETGIGRALMIGAILLVRVSIEHHPLIKRAKDMGSAAVTIALVNVVIVWSLVLLG